MCECLPCWNGTFSVTIGLLGIIQILPGADIISPLDIWPFITAVLRRTACFTHCLSHWVSSPSVALPLGSLDTSRHCTIPYAWLLVPVWAATSTHTSNMLPQLLFFLDFFSSNYCVRSTWFFSCFDLKQKYFTRRRVSHFSRLSPLLHLQKFHEARELKNMSILSLLIKNGNDWRSILLAFLELSVTTSCVSTGSGFTHPCDSAFLRLLCPLLRIPHCCWRSMCCGWLAPALLPVFFEIPHT